MFRFLDKTRAMSDSKRRDYTTQVHDEFLIVPIANSYLNK